MTLPKASDPNLEDGWMDAIRRHPAARAYVHFFEVVGDLSVTLVQSARKFLRSRINNAHYIPDLKTPLYSQPVDAQFRNASTEIFKHLLAGFTQSKFYKEYSKDPFKKRFEPTIKAVFDNFINDQCAAKDLLEPFHDRHAGDRLRLSCDRYAIACMADMAIWDFAGHVLLESVETRSPKLHEGLDIYLKEYAKARAKPGAAPGNIKLGVQPRANAIGAAIRQAQHVMQTRLATSALG